MEERILHFRLRAANPAEVTERLHPHGEVMLNRTEWMRKEPRTCGVIDVRSEPHTVGDPGPLTFNIKIAYRPKGCITWHGNTKYDGWAAVIVDRAPDGTLLNGAGKPLEPGKPPVELRFEVYKDIEFNDIDFGEFLGEVERNTVKRVQFRDVIDEIERSDHVNASMISDFVAPRRHRPVTKIILSNQPSVTMKGRFNTDLINVNITTPQLEQVLLDRLAELMFAFVEGAVSVKSISNGQVVFVDLSDSLVDCTPNERGEQSRFDVLAEYLTPASMEELAERIMARYAVEVSVVEGEESGLLLRRTKQEW